MAATPIVLYSVSTMLPVPKSIGVAPNSLLEEAVFSSWQNVAWMNRDLLLVPWVSIDCVTKNHAVNAGVSRASKNKSTNVAILTQCGIFLLPRICAGPVWRYNSIFVFENQSSPFSPTSWFVDVMRIVICSDLIDRKERSWIRTFWRYGSSICYDDYWLSFLGEHAFVLNHFLNCSPPRWAADGFWFWPAQDWAVKLRLAACHGLVGLKFRSEPLSHNM